MTSSHNKLIPLAESIVFSENDMSVHLKDGRCISVPLSWFPRLLQASPQSRHNWQLLGNGEGIHWPDADEDLSVAGLLHGFQSSGSSSKAI